MKSENKKTVIHEAMKIEREKKKNGKKE